MLALRLFAQKRETVSATLSTASSSTWAQYRSRVALRIFQTTLALAAGNRTLPMKHCSEGNGDQKLHSTTSAYLRLIARRAQFAPLNAQLPHLYKVAGHLLKLISSLRSSSYGSLFHACLVSAQRPSPASLLADHLLTSVLDVTQSDCTVSNKQG